MPLPILNPEERNTRVSALLRQVDEDVKAQKLDDALDRIRKVYEFDIKNIYARAYEERILILMMEKERAATMREAKQQAAEQVDQEVKRRLKDFYKQQELESQKRKQEEKADQDLENRARQASVNEVQEVAHKDISAIEKDTARKIEELEKRLTAQIQQSVPGTSSFGNATGAEYEVKLQQYKIAETERKTIQDEAFLKMKEEQKRAQDELMHKMEEERDALLEREHEKTKQQGLESYQTLMKLMMQLAVPSEMQTSLLQSLKISFSISDTEHMEAERAVQVSAYVDAVRKLWQSSIPSDEDFMHLKNLQQFFKISDDEHGSITKHVKKELGMPDDTAVIVVIDDDPSIRKYVDHILKKTYKTVITAATAETALPEIQKGTPSLIISDVNLGVGMMSGFSFYEKIIAGAYGEGLKSVAYVLMSSMEDDFFVRSAKQMGVKAYLAKPFTRESLEATVKNALA